MFEKGKSGNPNGRPKSIVGILAKAREHAPEALDKLVSLMRSDNEQVAFKAALAIVERAHGKPAQTLDLSNSDGSLRPVEELNVLELARESAALRKALGLERANASLLEGPAKPH